MTYREPSGPPVAGGQQQQTPTRRRDTTWLWAILTFGILMLVSLIGVSMIVSGGRLPDLGDEASWTPGPDQVQQAQQVPQAAPGMVAGLAVGAQVMNANVGPVNLRQTPGFQNKPASDVIVAVPAGAVGTLVGGPQEVDGLVWWRVNFGENEGWMAERSSRGVLLLDVAP